MKTNRLRSKSHKKNVPENELDTRVSESVKKSSLHQKDAVLTETTTAVSQNNKHQVTPLKENTKCSKTKGDDVHSSCTTPKSRFSKNVVPNASRFSNSYFMEENQDDVPEITWEFDSPKTEKDLQEAAKSMTIDHLLANLNKFCEDDAECNSQSSTFAMERSRKNSKKLILGTPESTIKDKSPVIKKGDFLLPSPIDPMKLQRRRRKKARPEKTAEVLQILQSLSGEEKHDIEKENERGKSTILAQDPHVVLQYGKCEPNIQKSEIQSCLSNIKKKNVCDIDSTEEIEIWGEDATSDDSLIVRATQEMENCIHSSIPESPFSQNTCSYIPETYHSKGDGVSAAILQTSSVKTIRDSIGSNDVTISQSHMHPHAAENMDVDIGNPNSNVVEMPYFGFSTDWDSALDNDEDWYNDVISSCDKPKKIPPDIVHAITVNNLCNDYKSFSNKVGESCEENSMMQMTVSSHIKPFSERISCMDTNNIVSTLESSDAPSNSQSDVFFNAKSFPKEKDPSNDAETEFFVDKDDLLDDPEVLTWLDEVESMPSTTKCCDEEIALKREAAIKKLRKKRNQRKV